MGVIIGSGIGGIRTHEVQNERYLEGGPSRISPFYIPMMIPDIASGIVSELAEGLSRAEDVDLDRAARLVRERLVPFLEEHKDGFRLEG